MFLTSNANLMAVLKTLPKEELSCIQAESFLLGDPNLYLAPTIRHFKKYTIVSHNDKYKTTLIEDRDNNTWCIITNPTLSIIKRWIKTEFINPPALQFAICLQHYESGIPNPYTEQWFQKTTGVTLHTQETPFFMSEEETKDNIDWLEKNYLPKVFPGVTSIRITVQIKNLISNWPITLDGLDKKQFYS